MERDKLYICGAIKQSERCKRVTDVTPDGDRVYPTRPTSSDFFPTWDSFLERSGTQNLSSKPVE